MNTASTVPILAPSPKLVANASQVSVGAPVHPLQRLQIMDEDAWEEFILEWVDSLRQIYTDVHHCGGGRDLGRDVIGFKAGVNPLSPWDNYQCKHYARGLGIADVVAEVGKLLYHASQGEFSLPDGYFFVAPQGPSTALLKALQKGTLKQELLDRWDKECRSKIAKGKSIALATVQETIDAFEFSRVSVVPPLRIIEGHRKTTHYVGRFGGGLPDRTMPIPKPPAIVQDNEHIYIKKLLDAYADEKKTPFATIAALQADAPKLAKHLDRSREQFFSAESLRTFSRDNVPQGTFESLQTEVFDGVQEVYEDESHSSGYHRVVKTIQKARDIAITGNPLIGVMHTNDRAGICHQLANDYKMTWVHPPEDEKP
jgi:hypothetical protein